MVLDFRHILEKIIVTTISDVAGDRLWSGPPAIIQTEDWARVDGDHGIVEMLKKK